MVWAQDEDKLSVMQQAGGWGASKERVLSPDQKTFEILGDVQVVRAPGCLPVVPRPSCGRSNSNWGYASCLPAGNGIMGKQLSWLFSQHLLPTQLPGSRELPGWVSKCLLRRMRLFERSACGAVSHERVGEISLSHKVPTFQHLLAKKKKKNSQAMDLASECIRWPTVWVWDTVDAGWRERRRQDVSAQEGDLIIGTWEFWVKQLRMW